jgi:DNA-binding transcriptional MerR regulator
MNNPQDFKIFKPREFAKFINVTVKTLQNWDNTGILVAKRTPTNRRYYTSEDLKSFLDNSNRNNRKEVV